jgi:hypothetical protein
LTVLFLTPETWGQDIIISPEGGNFSGAWISERLQTGDVRIQSPPGSCGDIYVADSITWSQNTLILAAGRNIIIRSRLHGSGTAKLSLEYGQGLLDDVAAVPEEPVYRICAPVDLPAGPNFETRLGQNNPIPFTVITGLGAAGSNTGRDLQGIQGNPAGNYALGADIDAGPARLWNSGSGFQPIGDGYYQGKPSFTGCFDGLGHTIFSLTQRRTNDEFSGLFARARFARIRHLSLADVSITGSHETGALVGWADNTTISLCRATGEISATQQTGGLVGVLLGGAVERSYFSGTVSATNPQTGGLVGFVSLGARIQNCCSAGMVAGSANVAGLVGRTTGTCSIRNSYTSALVQAQTSSGNGPLVGYNQGSTTVTGSYWNRDIAGIVSASDGEGLTTEQMRSLSSFEDWDIDSQGGTNTVWRLYEGQSEPFLRDFLIPITIGRGGKTYDGTATVCREHFPWICPWVTAIDFTKISGEAAITGSDVGVYPVDRNTFFSTREGYDISVSDEWNFTISPRNLSAVFQGCNKTYDGTTIARVTTDPLYGIVEGDEVYFISCSAEFFDPQAGAGKPVRVTDVVLGGADAINYYATETTTTADILPAPLTVTAENVAKIFDGSPYFGGGGVRYDGFVGVEGPDVLEGALVYGGTSQGAIHPGTYTIEPSGLASDNYAIRYESGFLTIYPVYFQVQVSADPPEGGTAAGEGSYSTGVMVTVQAFPNSGFSFQGWTEEGETVSTSAEYCFAIDRDRNLKAVFQKEPDPNPVPHILNLNPPVAEKGRFGFPVSVIGTGFISSQPDRGGSVVIWNGLERSTTYVDSTCLQVMITESDTGRAGNHPVQVFNPTPGGGMSETAWFGVTEDALVPPIIELLDPSEKRAGETEFILNVLGSGFRPDGVVYWNGEERKTFVLSESHLQAEIPALDIASTGTALVTVRQTQENSPVESNSKEFRIYQKAPVSHTVPTFPETGALFLAGLLLLAGLARLRQLPPGLSSGP